MKKLFVTSALALILAACTDEAPDSAVQEPQTEMPADAAAPAGTDQMPPIDEAAAREDGDLDSILDSQSDEMKARYQWRHPKETLEFFGVEPGMTVVDVLPGDGWYTRILLPYLGPDGKVIGVDYSLEMWPHFGQYAPDPEERKSWTSDWPEEAAGWCDSGCADTAAFAFGGLPEDMKGTADVVLMMRAAHHFNRLENEGGFFTQALKDTMDVLKPGGVVGVVQHRAPADSSDDWAVGNAGYVKQQTMIDAFEAAGFELVDTSEINANPNDKPTTDDVVWRLPPSLMGGEETRAEMEAIGESDRMTLKFRKPA